MGLKNFLSKQTIKKLSRFSGRPVSTNTDFRRNASAIATLNPSPSHLPYHGPVWTLPNPGFERPIWSPQRNFSSLRVAERVDSEEAEEDGEMTEFLSRFVWIMRGKLCEGYADCDKQTIDGMLLVIVEKVVSEMEKGGLEQMLGSTEATPSKDFSDDLWKTVWEVSNLVLDDMQKARKKEKMKGFLQSEEVKQMYRFAGEIGVKGDMLRELRFKWAREKMDESDFYQNLERIREEAKALEREEKEKEENLGCGKAEYVELGSVGNDPTAAEDKLNAISLSKRHGKIKYKIYGLDLSGLQWAEVADRIHETEEILWPQEAKTISGKCKLVTERILSLKEQDDPSPLLAEWAGLLQPSKVDWMSLLDRLKEQNPGLYYKTAELVLNEKSFQTNVRDYSKLIDAYAKENRLVDAERILKKMNENGIVPDVLTSTVLVHMYSKVGNLDRAREAFENLRSQGFRPDMKAYSSMIMAYVNANQPKLGEALMREMEDGDIKPTKEIYMALLQSFAQRGDVGGAHRISTTMQFAKIQQNLETSALLIEAYGRAGDPDQARNNFDYMRLRHRPDDRCIANMIAAYEKKNLLDKALNLLLELEKDGLEPGVATYTVLLDWLSKLQLVDEAEKMLGKIAEQGEAPPFEVHVSLCAMYSRAGIEKKALQALGVLEAKKEQLGQEEFERIINGLIAGGFVQDARRIQGIMESLGFPASEQLKVALMASQAFGRKRPTIR